MKKALQETTYFANSNLSCPICGINSFDHIHRAGTLPKDFERVTPHPKDWCECKKLSVIQGDKCCQCGKMLKRKAPHPNDWEEEYEEQFGFLNKIIERYAVPNAKERGLEVNWGKRIKSFIRSLLAHQRESLIEDIRKDAGNCIDNSRIENRVFLSHLDALKEKV